MKFLAGTTASFFLLINSAALAATPATVELTTAIAKPATVVAAGAVWRCADTSCHQTSTGSVSKASACHELSRRVGPIAKLSVGDSALSEEQLAKCNVRK